MTTSWKIPPISAEEETPLVKALLARIYSLLEEVQRQSDELQQMRDETAILKGEKARPKFKSSKMDENTNHDVDKGEDKDEKPKRAGSAKRSKTAELTIHEEKLVPLENPLPPGSKFNDYSDFVVQGLKERFTIRAIAWKNG